MAGRAQIASQRKRTGVLSPKRFVARLKRDVDPTKKIDPTKNIVLDGTRQNARFVRIMVR